MTLENFVRDFGSLLICGSAQVIYLLTKIPGEVTEKAVFVPTKTSIVDGAILK